MTEHSILLYYTVQAYWSMPKSHVYCMEYINSTRTLHYVIVITVQSLYRYEYIVIKNASSSESSHIESRRRTNWWKHSRSGERQRGRRRERRWGCVCAARSARNARARTTCPRVLPHRSARVAAHPLQTIFWLIIKFIIYSISPTNSYCF